MSMRVGCSLRDGELVPECDMRVQGRGLQQNPKRQNTKLQRRIPHGSSLPSFIGRSKHSSIRSLRNDPNPELVFINNMRILQGNRKRAEETHKIPFITGFPTGYQSRTLRNPKAKSKITRTDCDFSVTVLFTHAGTYICISIVNDESGERVPLVRIIVLTPCRTSSCMLYPGLKHQ